jgi:demethylmenaquinone methyltransferase/2-methoxy-6-polyprenyl-1,4-benzoquinol methylase
MPTQQPTSPVWDDRLLQKPHAVADKQSRVREMFAAIAPSYDLNNRLHSFWQDQRWRRKADVACGTGDLTIAMAHALWPNLGDWPPARGQVIGIDYTFAMLPHARRKAQRLVEGGSSDRPLTTSDAILWLNGDAQQLPLPDASADVVSIAFGIRNVQDMTRALREFRRILRPGGRLIILEFSRPTNRLIRWCNDLYCVRIMPHTATWISGDKSGAYKYLPMSVQTFIDREQMMQMMRDAGFDDVTQHPLTFGVCVCYRGFVRA